MKIKIIKPQLNEEAEVLDLTLKEKIKLIARLNAQISALEKRLQSLQAKVNNEDHIDSFPELLDACSNLKNSVSGKRTAKRD